MRLRRWILTAAIIIPCIGALSSSLLGPETHGPSSKLGCWVLPNLRVLPTPLAADCPLKSVDSIRAVNHNDGLSHVRSLSELADALTRNAATTTLHVERRGDPILINMRDGAASDLRFPERAIFLLVACAFFLGIPTTILWSSTTSGAVPLCVFYGSYTVLVIGALTPDPTPRMSYLALAGLTLAPASLFHLALAFPRERSLLREVPDIAKIPYIGSVFLLVLGSYGLFRNPVVWTAFLYVLLGISIVAWLVPIVSSGYAMRDSPSRLERTRSRLFVFGALILPIFPALLLTHGVFEPAAFSVAYLWSGAAVLPLPIALGISQYDLFDLGDDSRRWITAVLSLSMTAIVMSGALALTSQFSGWNASFSILSLLLVSLACLLAVEPVRRYLPSLLESVVNARARQLIDDGRNFARRIQSSRDEDDAAGHIGRLIQKSLGSTSIAIFVSHKKEHRLAYLGGEPALASTALSIDAHSALSTQHWIRPDIDDGAIHHRFLAERGVDAAIGIDHGSSRLGVILLGPPNGGRAYSGFELDFVSTAASQAASALQGLHEATARLETEREAAFGRALIAIAHDTGKDLGWIRRLLTRIQTRPYETERVSRDAKAAAELSADIILAMNRLVREASAENISPETPTLGSLIEGAIRRVSAHGEDRVIDVVGAGARSRRFPHHLGRVIGNLLDNALAASPTEASVHLHATCDGNQLLISIDDQGTGIPKELSDRVFEPGFTTKQESGGLGVGLTAANQLVNLMGGSLTLDSQDRCGTTATVTLPDGDPYR